MQYSMRWATLMRLIVQNAVDFAMIGFVVVVFSVVMAAIATYVDAMFLWNI